MTPTAFTIGLASGAGDIEIAGQAACAFAQGRGADPHEAETTASVLRDLAGWVAEACFPPPSTERIDITLTTVHFLSAAARTNALTAFETSPAMDVNASRSSVGRPHKP